MISVFFSLWLDCSEPETRELAVVVMSYQHNNKAYFNLMIGELVVQFSDQGNDGQTLSYNATHQSCEPSNTKTEWQSLGEKRIELVGSRNKKGSYLIRRVGSLPETRFNWENGRYIANYEDGRRDVAICSESTCEWIFMDASNRIVERYNALTGWIVKSRDAVGNGFDYQFRGDKLTSIRNVRSRQELSLNYYKSGKLAYVNSQVSKGDDEVNEQISYDYDKAGRIFQISKDL